MFTSSPRHHGHLCRSRPVMLLVHDAPPACLHIPLSDRFRGAGMVAWNGTDSGPWAWASTRLHWRESGPGAALGTSSAASLFRCGLCSVPLRDRRERCLYDGAAVPIKQCRCPSPGTPMYAAFSAFSGPPPSQPLTGAPPCSVPEQVAEAQGVRHFQERRIVPRVGQHVLVPPAPRGLGMDVETPVYLRPRQLRLLLEPHEALREVVGEDVDYSVVVRCAVSASGRPPTGRSRSFSPNASASVPYPLRLSAWATRSPVGALASPVRPWVLAFLLPRTRRASREREGWSSLPLPWCAHPCRYWSSPSPGKPQAVFDPSL